MTTTNLLRDRRKKAAKLPLKVARYNVVTTPEGKAQAQRRADAAGIDLSDFVRAQVEDAKVRPVSGAAAGNDALAALAMQLQRQGTNLSRLAAIAHNRGQIDSHQALEETLAELRLVWRKVLALE